MKKCKIIVLGLFLSTCIIFFAVGCASTMALQYKKPPINEMNRGDVFLIVNDQRPAEKGGNDPTRVGTIRNTFGMPFPLNSRADRDPSTVIKQLVTDCLNAAGYNVIEQPSNALQLLVVIKSFWSDGYQHSRIWTELPSKLKKDDHSPPIWEHTFESNIGATWKVGYGPFNKGINSMLEDIKTKMLAEFNDPKFYNNFK
jgi:hypothetical protein